MYYYYGKSCEDFWFNIKKNWCIKRRKVEEKKKKGAEEENEESVTIVLTIDMARKPKCRWYGHWGRARWGASTGGRGGMYTYFFLPLVFLLIRYQILYILFIAPKWKLEIFRDTC